MESTNITKEFLSKYRMPNFKEDFGVNQLFGLYDLINKFFNKKSIVCEVGSMNGVSTELFAKTCKTVYSVDQFRREELSKIIKKYNIKFFQSKSPEASSIFSNNFFDGIYLDNSHKYEHVCEEIKAWLPKVKLGGVICGHDFFLEETLEYYKKNKRDLRGNSAQDPSHNIPPGYGVRRAVEHSFKNKKIYNFSDSSWAVIKSKVIL